MTEEGFASLKETVSAYIGVENAPPLTHPCGLTPLEFNVLVEQDAVKEKTEGGLILIDQEKQKHQTTRGTVVALGSKAGSDIWTDEQGVNVGDRVVFAQYGGTFIEGADGVKYRALKDKDIIAVLA
jgi:chaperonin GroES